LERAIVQHFGCINRIILQAFDTKHVQNFIHVVDKPRERAIVRQGCHNQSIIVIIASNTWERAIVQHIGCINGRVLQAWGTKHVHNFSLVVDKPREREIIRQGCHNTSIIVIIVSNTWERAIVQHIACNRQ
jgi:hypothetical protein